MFSWPHQALSRPPGYPGGSKIPVWSHLSPGWQALTCRSSLAHSGAKGRLSSSAPRGLNLPNGLEFEHIREQRSLWIQMLPSAGPKMTPVVSRQGDGHWAQEVALSGEEGTLSNSRGLSCNQTLPRLQAMEVRFHQRHPAGDLRTWQKDYSKGRLQ